MIHANLESNNLTSAANTCKDGAMKRELETIQKQRADAERELKSLDTRRAELEQWLRDLVVTERTMARVLEVDLPNTVERPAATASRRKKPENIPSVYDMAQTVIRERGDEFVEGQDIVAGIKARWWPEASNNDIGPTLWRLAMKDQRLRKEGTKYGLPIRTGLLKPLSLARAAD